MSESPRHKFLRYFKRGFQDEQYVAWERGYKWLAHERWEVALNQKAFRHLLDKKEFSTIATEAVKIESRTNLLFSFEKMALRDAIKSPSGSRAFARGLFAFLYGKEPLEQRFAAWIEVLSVLPRKQTRVLTWPLATIFGFIALPKEHFFLKPNVTRKAATFCGFNLDYRSRPNSNTYLQLLDWAEALKKELAHLKPQDMIDIQSFLWVLGSDEYA